MLGIRVLTTSGLSGLHDHTAREHVKDRHGKDRCEQDRCEQGCCLVEHILQLGRGVLVIGHRKSKRFRCRAAHDTLLRLILATWTS